MLASLYFFHSIDVVATDYGCSNSPLQTVVRFLKLLTLCVARYGHLILLTNQAEDKTVVAAIYVA